MKVDVENDEASAHLVLMNNRRTRQPLKAQHLCIIDLSYVLHGVVMQVYICISLFAVPLPRLTI